ncbi:MAG TPA: hypothetical protein VLR88_00615 [Propionibacteriaceae bacterium]|nr:hypothetical protein [Propionibacteriaceae bacterium]
MTDLLIACLLGFAGGCFGAAIGGNLAFGACALLAPVCWGISARTGSPFALDQVAFGPFFGPHVGFSGAGAATIYAASRGLLPSGRLVNLPLAPLRDARVIAVGGAFGAFGVLVSTGVAGVPWFGSHTDRVALTVIVAAFTARFLFGDRTIIHRGRLNPGSRWGGRIAPTADHCWLPAQEQPRHYLLLGAVVGGLAGSSCLLLGRLAPHAATSANAVMFGVSGWAVIALTLGTHAWVTHHIANIGGLATILVVPLVIPGADPWSSLGDVGTVTGAVIALLAGIAAGVLAAWAAEVGARLFLNRSDSYIDPPALSIFPCATLLRGLLAGG